ncbi:MAG: cytochrome c subfamily [Chloroflexi bacterium]|nr:cytochrome c subfamily [Chloroflexota bacterium]
MINISKTLNMIKILNIKTLIMTSIFMLFVAGCGEPPPTYPLDIFPEMHYNQSYKTQEPPALSAPADSVPITGKEVIYSLKEAQALTNPVPYNRDSAHKIYTVNCTVCHGAQGLGDGPMRAKLEAVAKEDWFYGTKGNLPANLSSNGSTVAKPDGEIYQTLTHGYAGAYGLPHKISPIMPAFRTYLTPEERWQLVHYIRNEFQK